MIRMLVFAGLALALMACSDRRNGNDGMDGRGFALGLKHELEEADRDQ